MGANPTLQFYIHDTGVLTKSGMSQDVVIDLLRGFAQPLGGELNVIPGTLILIGWFCRSTSDWSREDTSRPRTHGALAGK